MRSWRLWSNKKTWIITDSGTQTKKRKTNPMKKPNGVPEENWLPINRKDEDLSINLRIYVPDLEKMKTWKAPIAEKL
jgi:hypothetical protein